LEEEKPLTHGKTGKTVEIPIRNRLTTVSLLRLYKAAAELWRRQ
jgi:hypothetical protein